MENEMNGRVFKALADPTRLHIVEFLSSCCCGQAAVRDDGAVEGPTAGEICCHVTGEEKINSTVSHHLHELQSASLVSLEKRGKATLCRLQTDTLRTAAAELIRLSEGTDSCGCCGSACECR